MNTTNIGNEEKTPAIMYQTLKYAHHIGLLRPYGGFAWNIFPFDVSEAIEAQNPKYIQNKLEHQKWPPLIVFWQCVLVVVRTQFIVPTLQQFLLRRTLYGKDTKYHKIN